MIFISVITYVYYVYFKGIINKTMTYFIFFQVYFNKHFFKPLILLDKNIQAFAHVYVYFMSKIR